ncbi:hypothetical protein [Sphingomonas sp. Ant20]|uniref:hypothetical protein n=1 Tax=Sphingomonas sp. Ant20 TaxID=104605 RepID=UPI000FE149FE|nr:hypothetical protein [Sphingomonas sp. Ant20]
MPNRKFLSLERGVFSRGDAKSKISVKADGRSYPVQDDGYVDSIEVAAIGSREVRERDYFRGKLVYSVNYRASADGDKLTKTVVNHSKPDHRAIISTITSRRIGGLRHSGSAVAGTWKLVGIETTRGHRTETILLRGSRFTSVTPGGSGFDATIGGPPVPVRGDAADGRIAVSMPNESVIVIDMSRNGKATVHKTMTLLPDQRTIAVSARRLNDGVNTEWILRKQ